MFEFCFCSVMLVLVGDVVSVGMRCGDGMCMVVGVWYIGEYVMWMLCMFCML